MVGADSRNDVRLAEWQEARRQITDIDGNVTDLRKFGLSFVSALLAAQGLLYASSPGSASYVSPLAKLVVVGGSLLLLCALFIVERILRTIQRAAVARARIIERDLDVGLTDAVSLYYQTGRTAVFIDLLYLFFVAASGALGYAVLAPDTLSIGWFTVSDGDVVITVLAALFLIIFRLETSDPVVDWSLDKHICKAGATVRVTFTNLSSCSLALPSNWRLFFLESDEGALLGDTTWNEKSRPIEPGGSRSWWIETTNAKAGTYTLRYSQLITVPFKQDFASMKPSDVVDWHHVPKPLLVSPT